MISFGFTFLAIISLSQAISLMKEHSLLPPFTAGNANLLTWDLTGNTELGGTYIRLTPDEANKHGAIWNSFPCFSNNWEFQVQFQIHGKGVHLNGDGMAIWYVKESDMLHSGPVFGSKDYFTGLGVFIDTFANEPDKHHHPYISAMVNNGSLHYEHNEDGTMTQIGGCNTPVRNIPVPTKIAVSYINNDLAVYVDNEGLGQWKLCFKSVGVHLPTGYNFGISASTSEHSDNHDILAASALNFDPDNLEWEDKNDVIPHADNIEIPQRYHKEFIEEELQKIEKREIKHEDTDEEEEHEEPKMKIRKKKEEHEEPKMKIRKEETEQKEETIKTAYSTTESTSPSTSLIRKLVYITGVTAIIMVSISVYKKYRERRRIHMEKRLY